MATNQNQQFGQDSYGGLSVGANDGPLLRFYLKSASAVWDYILSQNSIKKMFPLPVILGSLITKYTNGLLQAITELPTSTLAELKQPETNASFSKLTSRIDNKTDMADWRCQHPVRLPNLFFWHKKCLLRNIGIILICCQRHVCPFNSPVKVCALTWFRRYSRWKEINFRRCWSVLRNRKASLTHVERAWTVEELRGSVFLIYFFLNKLRVITG